MDKPSHSWSSRTQNRGVNITSEEFPPAEENVADGGNPLSFPSLCNMKNQLQNAIDVMGPATPHLVYTSSSVDADNEESVISSTSIFSSILQIKQPGRKDQTIITGEYDSPRDISETSANQESESLILVQDYPQEKQPQPLCVPAVLPPAVLCMNPSCLCTHAVTYTQPVPAQSNYEDQIYSNQFKRAEKRHRLSDIIGKLTKTHKKSEGAPAELYRMNVMQPRKDGSPPRRFVFDLMDNVPKRDVNTIGTNTKKCGCTMKTNEQAKATLMKKGSFINKGLDSTNASHYSGIVVTHSGASEKGKLQDTAYYDNLEKRSKLHYRSTEQTTARVDVYYFDHGNAAYYRTTDSPPLIMTELVAERTEIYATKFWAELFGTIYIAFAFFTSFILQFLRFILHSLIRPLTIGLLQLVSDYFFKPLLAAVFNAIIQPPLIFFYNIATSLRDLCDPLAEGVGYFLREISVLCKVVRLFEIRQEKRCNIENVKPKCECGQNQKQAPKCSCP